MRVSWSGSSLTIRTELSSWPLEICIPSTRLYLELPPYFGLETGRNGLQAVTFTRLLAFAIDQIPGFNWRFKRRSISHASSPYGRTNAEVVSEKIRIKTRPVQTKKHKSTKC